jgi:hypothetical protein
VKKFRIGFSLTFLCLLFLSCPRSSLGQNYRPFAVPVPSGTNRANAAQISTAPLLAPNSAFNSVLTVSPSVFSSIYSPFYGFTPQTLQFNVGCLDLSTGNPIPNAIMQKIAPRAEAYSGGHLHDTNRDGGKVDPDHGVTGPITNPVLAVTYSAPEASGIIDLELTCSPQGGIPVTAILSNFIGVEIDGLESGASASSGILVIETQEDLHGNNNGNAWRGTIVALEEMAGKYFLMLTTKFGVPVDQVIPIRISALSLPQGGIFDYQTEWSPPHHNHRFGLEADVRLSNQKTRRQRQSLKEAFIDAGFTARVKAESPQNPHASHWHLFAPGAPL